MKIIESAATGIIGYDGTTKLTIGEGKINFSLLDIAKDCGEEGDFSIPYKNPSDFGMEGVEELRFNFSFFRGKPLMFCSSTEDLSLEDDVVELEDLVYKIEFDNSEEEQSFINFFIELGVAKGYYEKCSA